jgi:peroxiredoxin
MRLMTFLITLFFIICGYNSLTAQTTVLKGNAPDYEGLELVFYRYTDYITYTEEIAGKAMVDEEGYFELTIEANEINFIFSSVGIYRMYMFIRPGRIHEIALPERKDKTSSQILNPFFEETFVHIAVLNEDENGLNRLISSFEYEFETLFADIIQGRTIIHSPASLDSLVRPIEENYSGLTEEPFFDSYREYKYGFLQHVSLQQRSRSISDRLFLNRPVLYNNPAYMELFNQIYSKYFLFFGRTRAGRKIYDDIGKYQSLARLKTTLSSNEVLKEKNLLEFVILKGLHDGFYSADFSRKDLLVILDSLRLFSQNEIHREISNNVREKVTRLLAGYEPPPFDLYDKDGKARNLADFRGKYVYLNFCTPASYTCLSEFETLQWLKNKHPDYLEIVTILLTEDLETMQDFLTIRPYDWPFLFYGNQPKILKEYDVRTFPTYYLIDREGKLILSPAPSPSENFENALFRIMRANKEL